MNFWRCFWENWRAMLKFYHPHHLFAMRKKKFALSTNYNASQDKIILKHSSHETATHLRNATIGSEPCKDLQESVKRSSDAEEMWSTYENDGETYYVGSAQVYSNKSQTSPSLSALVFYHLHLTLLKFFEEQRPKLIRQGLTALA